MRCFAALLTRPIGCRYRKSVVKLGKMSRRSTPWLSPGVRVVQQAAWRRRRGCSQPDSLELRLWNPRLCGCVASCPLGSCNVLQAVLLLSVNLAWPRVRLRPMRPFRTTSTSGRFWSKTASPVTGPTRPVARLTCDSTVVKTQSSMVRSSRATLTQPPFSTGSIPMTPRW